jgi:hypothetical protein
MDTPHDVRARLLAALEADLVGPFTAGVAGIDPAEAAASDETLTLAPSRWYLTGFLAPQGARAPEPDDMDSNGGELAAGSESQADDAGSEEPEPKRPVRFPASMGLSVYLPASSKKAGDALVAEVSYADYDKVEVATDREDKKQNAWKRVAHGPVTVEVPLDEATLQKGIGVPGSRGLRLQGELRTTEMEGLEPGARVLSLFLVNDRAALEQDRDLNFVFQVRLALRYEHGFLWRPNRKGEDAGHDDDPRVLALLFRDRREWAVGHNTSLLSPVAEADGKVRTLRTTQIPRYEVPDVEHRPVPSLVTSMSDLAKLDAKGLSRALTPLVEEYGKWLDTQRYTQLDRKSLEDTRDALVGHAERTKARIAAGIALLTQDERVREAFVLANKAMHIAAIQADRQREDPRYKEGKTALVATLPARLRADEPRAARRPDARGSQARRPHLLPHRRRQDRGVPRPHRVHAALAAPAREVAPRRGPRRGGHPPLHAAPPHARSARTRRHAHVRARRDAQPRAEEVRQHALHRGPLGRARGDGEPPQGSARRAQRLQRGQQGVALPAHEVPLVRRPIKHREHQARR